MRRSCCRLLGDRFEIPLKGNRFTMFKSLFSWLYPRTRAECPAYTRTLPFVIPAGATDEQIQGEIFDHVINTGETAFGERQPDGSVLVHE